MEYTFRSVPPPASSLESPVHQNLPGVCIQFYYETHLIFLVLDPRMRREIGAYSLPENRHTSPTPPAVSSHWLLPQAALLHYRGAAWLGTGALLLLPGSLCVYCISGLHFELRLPKGRHLLMPCSQAVFPGPTISRHPAVAGVASAALPAAMPACIVHLPLYPAVRAGARKATTRVFCPCCNLSHHGRPTAVHSIWYGR